MPAEEHLRAGCGLNIDRQPIVRRRGSGALLDKGVGWEETQIINVRVRSEKGWNTRVKELLAPAGVKTLRIFTGFERLRPEDLAGMARIIGGIFGHIAPDRKSEHCVRINGVTQPGTPQPDIV